MKAIKWKTLIIPLGWLVLIALTILFFYKPVRFLGSIIKESVKDRQRSVRLLSETDHQALLEACREISKEVSTGNMTAPNHYIVRYKPDPEISRFPQIVLDIEPLCIDIYNDGRISLEMTGAFHHSGVTAYPENYEKPSDNFKFGDRELIPGLWYYNDGYHEDPEFGKKIDKLIEKHKKK